MAALTHLGVGLAAKSTAPRVPVGILIASAYAIDIIWGIFYFAGIEHLPGPDHVSANPWSHGLFMALVWSLLAGLLAWRLGGRRTGVVIGLLVLSHWVVDFISHPMTAAFPDDTGLPIFFSNEPLIGLGVWSSELGMNIGEYGGATLGLVIYLVTRWRLQWRKQMQPEM
jgi:hypothetical protein